MKKTLRPSGGHILDIDSLEIADQYLSLAHNVHTRKGFPSRIGGRRVAYPVFGESALHLRNVQLNTFNWWLLFGSNFIKAVEGSNLHDITFPGQQTVSDIYEWTSDSLNGIPVFSNGRDPLLYWNGDAGSPAAVMPGWPVGQVCKAVCTFRFHVFALNISNAQGVFENMIVWSDAAEPGTIPQSWTPAPDNEAGSAFCADTPGPCIKGLPLGTQLMVYKRPAGLYAVEYQGQQPDNIFSVRPISRVIGALSPHCVLDLGTQHLVVGNDDVVLTNGIAVTSIAENRIKRALASAADEAGQLNTFVVRDLAQREVWVCVPERGAQFATIAHIWDERRNTWVTRSLNNVRYATAGFVSDQTVDTTWNADEQVWNADLSTWNAGAVSIAERVLTAEETALYVEDTFDSVVVTSRLMRTDLTMDDDEQIKVTQRVWIEGSGPGLASVRFRLGARNSTDANVPITWGAFVSRQAGGKPYEVAGRFISLEIVATTEQAWTIDRIVIEARYDGTQ